MKKQLQHKRIENVEYVELIGSKMLLVQHKNGTTVFHLVNDEGTLDRTSEV